MIAVKLKRALVAALPLLALTAAAQQKPQPPADAAPASSRDTVVITGMVPIPDVGEGAAYYTPQELKKAKSEVLDQHNEAARGVFKCKDPKFDPDTRVPAYRATLERLFRNEMELANRVAGRAGEAAAATEAAEKSRRAAAEGAATTQQVEDAELARQKAVTRLVDLRTELDHARLETADAEQRYLDAEPYKNDRQRYQQMVDQITWGELDFAADLAQRRMAAEAKEWEGLSVTDISAARGEDRKGAFLAISGVIRSAKQKSANVPNLQVAAFDARGFVLKAEIVEAEGSGRRIAPGASLGFRYLLRPAPEAVARAAATFIAGAAPPLRVSINRLCGDS